MTETVAEPATTSTPTAAAPGHHQWIPLADLTPSPLNHRKHFDEAKMAELTDNVRVQGVIVPIIARPSIRGAGRYEIVAGERRFRAASAAGLTEIPAIVRDLTDAEALELQVIENNQRVDVHPLEEAEGYEALMQHAHYSVDDMAAKVGKSRAYVYARLKLLALCEAGRKALYEGTISASIALLLARIPVKKLQEKCLDEVLDDMGSGEPMSFREAKDHVENRYMLRLKEAPFKPGDAGLVPKAGACTDCPKRTGNEPELFADIANADVCTDPDCFEAKRKAHVEVQREKARDSGRPVISGKEAKKIYPHEYQAPSGYIRLDDRCPADEKNRNWSAVLGKAAADHTLIEKPQQPGEFVKALPVEAAQAALAEKGIKVKASQITGGPDTASERDEAHSEWEKRREQELLDRDIRFAVYCTWRDAIAKDGLGAEDIRAMLFEINSTMNGEPCDRVLKLWGFTDEQIEACVDIDAIAEAIRRAKPDELVPMLLDHVFTNMEHDDEQWAALAKARGVDRKAIERQVKKGRGVKPSKSPSAT